MSVPIAMVIAAPARLRPRDAERVTSAQRVESEIVADDRMAVHWDDYMLVVDAINDKLASPDPYTRRLAATASLALEDAAVPTW